MSLQNKMQEGSLDLFICRNTSSSTSCKVVLMKIYCTTENHCIKTCWWFSLVERNWKASEAVSSLFDGSNNTWDGSSCSLASLAFWLALAACSYESVTSCHIRDDALHNIRWHGYGWDGGQPLGHSLDLHRRAPPRAFQLRNAQQVRGRAGLGGSCLSS